MDRIFDMKCVPETCWYCKNLCDYCLKPAAFGLGSPSSSDPKVMLQFCGKECERRFICHETQFQVMIQLIPLTRLETHYIPHGHQELFRILGHAVLRENQAITFSLSVRMDSAESKYVIYSEKQQFARKYFEVFISTTERYFLPHVSMPIDNYEQDLVLLDYLNDVHIETGFLLNERYSEGKINDTVTIPIGVDIIKDPFYKHCCCFPKDILDNKWKVLLNSFYAYILVRELKNQELLLNYLIRTVVEQLQNIQIRHDADHVQLYREVFNAGQEILCELISGINRIMLYYRMCG